MDATMTKPLKVGELAKRTGLTVRTLHHYDAIGLLSPSHHTASGHRLYAARDVERLQQIVSLRQLGLALDEIRAFLARPDASPLRVLEMHAARLRGQIEAQQRLCDLLEKVAWRLRSAEEVSVDEIIRTIEGITMFEKYYTPEQLAWLEQRRRQVGEERIREVEAEWPRLFAEVREEMARGTDPASETAQALARRWMGLVAEFTGGDPGIERAVASLYRNEPQARERVGVDPSMMEWINRANAAAQQAG